MRKLFILPIVFALVLSASANARPGKDDNAAVRYLLAMGMLPPSSDVQSTEISNIAETGDVSQIKPETSAYFDDAKVKLAMQLLTLGSRCPSCNFTPDDKTSFEDPVPPYRKIRDFCKVAAVAALRLESQGEKEKAVTLLLGVFMLGQHLEEHGLIISGMVGFGCRNLALKILEQVLERNPSTELRVLVQEKFKTLPRPALNLIELIKYERSGVENVLHQAKKNPSLILESLVDYFRKGTEGVRVASKAKACKANLRVLTGAVEMLQMDYEKGLPATQSEELVAFLVKEKYLLDTPKCPVGAKYSIAFSGNEFVWNCSKNCSSVDSEEKKENKKSEQTKQVEEKALNYIKSAKFEKHVAETLAWYDEFMKHDPLKPETPKIYQEISDRIEASSNIIAKDCIPSIKSAAGHVAELQAKIDNFMKK